MTERASMFLTGPGVVREACGEEIDAGGLGGPRVHLRNGVCSVVTSDDVTAAWTVRDLLALLPAHAGLAPPRRAPAEPAAHAPDAGVPASPRKVYDVRHVATALVDDGELLEVNPRWGRNMLCAFARLDGRPVGVVANQPRHLGGVIDGDAAAKAARFVRTCDLYGLPLVVLVDTPGFLPGTRQEHAGIIRHGAKLVHAFAAATVPRVTVVLRKAFGGAFIAMNARDLGADRVLAWPQAEIGVMAARQAVGLINRRDIAAADDPDGARDRLADRYAADQLTAEAAAAAGVIDDIVAPADTRDELAGTLAALAGAERGFRPMRNVPG
jgi:acetyl-CoA carboxylase carboxyltransferase component